MSKPKKKPTRRPYRNNGGPAPSPARPPRPRPPRGSASAAPETKTQRLAYTALGAAGTALVGGFLARQNWAPKTIASVLTAAGGALAWAGNSEHLQSIGTGTMASGGSQLALLLLDDHEQQKAPADAAAKPKPRQAALAPGGLVSAFERARSQMGLVDDFDDAR